MALLLSVVRAAVPLRSAAHTATRTFALSAPDAEERLSGVLATLDRVKTGDGVPTASFAELGFTPLEIAEVVVAVEDEFAVDIPDKDANSFKDFNAIVNFVSSLPKAK